MMSGHAAIHSGKRIADITPYGNAARSDAEHQATLGNMLQVFADCPT